MIKSQKKSGAIEGKKMLHHYHNKQVFLRSSKINQSRPAKSGLDCSRAKKQNREPHTLLIKIEIHKYTDEKSVCQVGSRKVDFQVFLLIPKRGELSDPWLDEWATLLKWVHPSSSWLTHGEQ